jgi:hypothetical protein
MKNPKPEASKTFCYNELKPMEQFVDVAAARLLATAVT